MAPVRTLKIVNESSYTPPGGDATLRSIAEAVSIQLRDVASAWGESIWRVVSDAHERGFRIVLLDNEGQGLDLGYHTLDADDRPYARVFLKPILNHGGHWTSGSLSVSACVSHEACEFVVDPATNRWAERDAHSLWSLEVCDPVEAFTYAVTLRSGSKIAVSDFVFPAWFDPLAGPRTRFDRMRRLHWPFEIAPDGYATRFSNGRTRTVWGPEYPAWRKRTKRACGSRTGARRTFGMPADMCNQTRRTRRPA
jgi:hypothetical protein